MMKTTENSERDPYSSRARQMGKVRVKVWVRDNVMVWVRDNVMVCVS